MTIHDIRSGGLLLLECISGSKAYGLATPQSDTDIKGVFYLPKDRFYRLDHLQQVSNSTNDEMYYELGRFVELLTKNNPNILELLATPEEFVLYKHPLMELLQPASFLSKLCMDTFAGYAMTQIRKARGYNKKIVNPVEPERKSVTDFCFIMQDHHSIPLEQWLSAKTLTAKNCGLVSIPHAKGLYALFYDAEQTAGYNGIVRGEQANDICLSSIRGDQQPIAYLFFNKEAYSAYCREYREYREWELLRNEERYSMNQAHGMNYDAKNMMHTIRLLQTAKEILRDGKLNVHRSNREELLAIKAGKFSYEELLEKANILIDEIKVSAEKSSLPEKPDMAAAERILIQMRTALYN
ncbi:MAG: nucleotidyltransferase domain-containing protein [Chitinophagaceae bacterium]